MKRSLFLLLFLLGALSLQAQQTQQTQQARQTLRGTVFNRQTGEAIPGVSVYLDGTATYTVTDANGRFTLTPRGFINTSLVFSHLSFNTVSIHNPFADLPERIGMEIRPYDIEAVRVQSAPFPRQTLMGLFRESFLGTTVGGRSCSIENEDDIGFSFDRDTKTLRAYSDAPLRIQNTYLGYDIVFNLTEFRVQLSSVDPLSREGNIVQFTGTSIYTDRREGAIRFARRRERAYESSVNAFFADIAWRHPEQSDFVLYRDKRRSERIDLGDLPVTITDSESVKHLTVDTTPTMVDLRSDFQTEVWFDFELGNRRYPAGGTSTIYFLDSNLLVDRYGNLDDPLDILKRGGALSMQGLGDMLPLDFETIP